jgi:ketosteroid isomerase-like protein
MLAARADGRRRTRGEQLAELAALDARLRDLESLTEIENLHREFTRAVADRKFGTFPGFFTDDGVIDMRRHGERRGRDAIKGHFDGMHAAPLTGAGYVLSSPILDVTGDTASGTWTWHRFLADGTVAGRPARVWGFWEEGLYTCSYRRTEDGWRFSRMHFRVVRPDHDDDPPDGGDDR